MLAYFRHDSVLGAVSRKGRRDADATTLSPPALNTPRYRALFIRSGRHRASCYGQLIISNAACLGIYCASLLFSGSRHHYLLLSIIIHDNASRRRQG